MSILSVVVGAQYGSEAKGHVTAQIVNKSMQGGWQVFNIRVAGPNAGHTVIDAGGVAWPFRQLPVGAVLPHRGTPVICGIAAGSEIEPAVLLAEIDQVVAAGYELRLIVDPEATILTEKHKIREVGMAERLGSTAKGIGAARASRIMRQAERVCDNLDLMRELDKRNAQVRSVAEEATNYEHTVIEGTQGYGLGLHAGHYPKCTSSDARAIDFLAMAGISPWSTRFNNFEVWVVARVFPIRVAGNSGYMLGETSWDRLNLPVERTTVTKKIRRVGAWDGELVGAAVAANGGWPVVRVALTMVDQEVPDVFGLDVPSAVLANRVVQRLVHQVEQDAKATVRMLTTSPSTAIWL